MQTKKCNKCGVDLLLECFQPDKKKSFGVHGTCKKCHSIYAKKRRDENQLNPILREQERQRSRDKMFRHRYGLTTDDYNQRVISQGNLCGVCTKAPKTSRHLVVDHCHETGKIRGLLCDGCNVAIAILDNKELLVKALAYLKR